MKVLNYHNLDLNLARLVDDGKSIWFVRGAAAGSRAMGASTGWSSARPRAALMSMRVLRNGWLEVTGKTTRFRSRLENLGGRLRPDKRAWLFPPAARDALHSDEEFVSQKVWSGVPESELRDAHEQFSQGYAWAQEKLSRIPHANIPRGGRSR